MYRDLTRMKTDCCDIPLEDFAMKEIDPDALHAFLDEYELRGLKSIVPNPGSTSQATAPAKAKAKKKDAAAEGGMLSLFGDAPVAKKEPEEPLSVVAVTSPEELPSLAGEDVGLLFEDNAFFIGMEGKEYKYSGPVTELVRALEHASVIATPSVQDLLRADDGWGYILSSQWFDLSLAAYLLDPESRNYTWPRLRQSIYQDGRTEFAEAAENLHPHAKGLAALAYMRGIHGQVEGAKLLPLMRELELPLIPVLVAMEKAGITVNTNAFKEFLDDVSSQLNELTRSIIEHAGETFNIRSSQQLAVILFDKLDIKEGTKTATGQRSTANQVLEKIRSKHPIVEDILQYRMLEKLRSTYLEPLPKLVDADSRLHTHFNQLATATGRLSSSKDRKSVV